MGLLKEKIEQSKKLPEQCLMKQNYQIIFGEKIYTQLSTHITEHESEKDKTPYELWYGIPSLVRYFKTFGSKCYIKRNEDDLGKFESRTDEGIFFGIFIHQKGI